MREKKNVKVFGYQKKENKILIDREKIHHQCGIFLKPKLGRTEVKHLLDCKYNLVKVVPHNPGYVVFFRAMPYSK